MPVNQFIIFAGYTTICILLSFQLHAQDSTGTQWKEQYLDAINKKTTAFNDRFKKRTGGMLKKLVKQEQQLRKKVSKLDPNAAQELFDYSIDSLKKFASSISSKTDNLHKKISGNYFPYLDSLQQSIGFLNSDNSVLHSAKAVKDKLNTSVNLTKELQNKLAVSEKINEFLLQRNKVLHDRLDRFPSLKNNIRKITKEAGYYRGQVLEWKETLGNTKKVEQLALTSLKKIPAFQKFLEQHSQLAGIFMPPGSFTGGGTENGIPIINGIEPRAAVQQVIQNSMPVTGMNATQLVQQQVGAAIGEMDKLRDKLNKQGGMGDKQMPDYIPNSQRTKSFRRRLELGTDLQFGRVNNFLPATGDIGFQVGYKLNDKTSFGVGAAYKLGLGTGWNKIRFTNESIGLRTYLRARLKGKFYAQGGGEWNYMTRFGSIEELKNVNAWQTSALIGAGKMYKVGKKLNGNIQLLFDFLYRQHKPATQPVLFRIGYNF